AGDALAPGARARRGAVGGAPHLETDSWRRTTRPWRRATRRTGKWVGSGEARGRGLGVKMPEAHLARGIVGRGRRGPASRLVVLRRSARRSQQAHGVARAGHLDRCGEGSRGASASLAAGGGTRAAPSADRTVARPESEEESRRA